MGTGDGGGGGDPDPRRPEPETPAGKILRIDPRGSADGEYTIPPDNPFYNQPPRRGEIWSYGLRNPWRFSFDRQTGDLSTRRRRPERVRGDRLQPARLGLGRGTNYGWSCREGRHPVQPNREPLCVGPPPPVSPSPSTSTRTAQRLLDHGRATWSATRRCRRSSAATSTATTARAALAHPAPGPDAQGDTNSGENVSSLYTWGEDACARVYAGSGSGASIAIPTTRLRRPTCAPARRDADRRDPGRGRQRDLAA